MDILTRALVRYIFSEVDYSIAWTQESPSSKKDRDSLESAAISVLQSMRSSFHSKSPQRPLQDIMLMGLGSTIADKLLEPPIITSLFAEFRPNSYNLTEIALKSVAVRPLGLFSSSGTCLLQHCFSRLSYYHRQLCFPQHRCSKD